MSIAAPSRSIDSLATDQLRRMLSAGSLRVFNCARLHRNAVKAEAPPAEYMFHKVNLNNVIYIKEPFTDENMASLAGRPVGTRVYFAYNEQDAFEGGRSIFVNDRTLREALQFHAGIAPTDESDEFHRDMGMLQMLEDLPSLDPFLLKDRLTSDGITVHEAYLEITEAEFNEIREFVMSRFRPIVEMAFQGSDQSQTTTYLRTLVEKLWEARDMEALAPVIQAMQLRAAEAPAIFYAWKGVIYYDYLRATQIDRWKDYAAFLGKETVPTDIVPRENRNELQEVVMMVRSLFKQRWMRVEKILADYNKAYNQVFKEGGSPAPFIDFLRASPGHFFNLGDSISSIDHAIEVWNGFRPSPTLRRMKFERLYSLMRITVRILE